MTTDATPRRTVKDIAPAEPRLAEVYKAAVDMVVEDAHDTLDQELWDSLGLTESPIERLFLVAMASHRVMDLSLRIRPQVKIGSYRVDFVVEYHPRHDTPVAVIIECDGHDYHERTKAQATRDKRRDRVLAAEGWTVLRFSGSEIHADPDECAYAVLEHLIEACNRARR